MKIKNIKKCGVRITIYSIAVALIAWGGKELKNVLETNQKNYDIINESLNSFSQMIEQINEESTKKSISSKYTLTEKEAKSLFYEDGKLVVDKISAPYEKFYYENTYVRKILKNGKKYLVDAENICKVLLCDYDSYGRVFYATYYKDGLTTGLHYYVVLKDDKHYIVNARNFNIVITNYEGNLLDYHTFYLKNYDYNYDGRDLGENSGYVTEIIKNGIKYLTDAQDFTKVLVSDYKEIQNCPEGILATFQDGSQLIIPKEEFAPQSSNIIIRELVQNQKM